MLDLSVALVVKVILYHIYIYKKVLILTGVSR